MGFSALLEFDQPIEQRGIGIIAPAGLAVKRELWRCDAPALRRQRTKITAEHLALRNRDR
jgi:hypothetical protein